MLVRDTDLFSSLTHVCGGFICGTALIWPQRLFKNLVAASNFKYTQMLSYGWVKVVRLGYVYVMVRLS